MGKLEMGHWGGGVAGEGGVGWPERRRVREKEEEKGLGCDLSRHIW